MFLAAVCVPAMAAPAMRREHSSGTRKLTSADFIMALVIRNWG